MSDPLAPRIADFFATLTSDTPKLAGWLSAVDAGPEHLVCLAFNGHVLGRLSVVEARKLADELARCATVSELSAKRRRKLWT